MTQNAKMQKTQMFDFVQNRQKRKWKYLRFVS